MMANHSYILVGILLGFCAMARADMLVLEDNETLSGRLVRVREGSVVFRTSLQGQMMVPMQHVAALSTEENYVITFQDDAVRYGKFQTLEGKPVLQPIEGGSAVAITLGEVTEATVLPRSGVTEDAGSELNLRANLGVQARSGTEHALTPIAELGVGHRSEASLFRGDVAVELADDFPRWLRGQLEWRSAREGIGPYAGLEVQRNRDNALSLRSGITLGVGRVLDAWQESEGATLYGLLGVNLEYEDWKSSLGRERETETDLGMRLGLRYARTLFGQSRLDGSHDLVPSLSDFGTIRADAETALTMPLADQLRLRLHLLIEYDETRPLREVERWNSSVGASVQLDF